MKRSLFICILAVLVALSCTCAVFATDYGAPFGQEYVQTVESAFTFAIVGDTQIISRLAPEKMDTIYQWIVDNKEEKNIQFVAGVGDITDKSEDFEWEASIKAIRKMDGIVPYSLVRGNHDTVETYQRYVNYDSYTSQLDGSFDGVLNTYQTITVGTLKYLFLNLDHGPSNEALQWACEVVEAHPEHNVIITTHGYIDEKGELLSPANSELCPSLTTGVNDGTTIWTKLARKYANIVMILCGHMGEAPEGVQYEAIGKNGNMIQQVMINSQHVDRYYEHSGIVTLFHFSEDGTQVQVENYSTLKQMHYGSGFTFNLNTMGGNANPPINWLLYGGIAAGAVIVLAAVIFLVLHKKKKAIQE